MSVRDVRQKWPEAERALAVEREIIITRDSRPVAKLVRYQPPRQKPRQTFDPGAHLRWLHEFWRGKPPLPLTDVELAQDRKDRH